MWYGDYSIQHFLDNLCIIKNEFFAITDVSGTGTIRFSFFKIGKIVFASISASNFMSGVIHNIGQFPKEFIPIAPVAFTIGNSFNAQYLIEITKTGVINVYGSNIKLNNIPFRTITYFTF